MINLFEQYTNDEKILILGFGREGKSTYTYLRKLFPNRTLYIMDCNDINDELENAVICSKQDYLQDIEMYDVVIKSPGIVLDKDIVAKIRHLESQTSLFLRKLGKQTIGITGTKGKSTTTSLLYHMLHSVNSNTFIVGNIGIPCFDVLEKINDQSIIVFELSCHQLEYTMYSPHIAILLNFYEEHLDHYGTFENYKNAKRHIYEYQKESDLLFCNSIIDDIQTKSTRILIGVNDKNSDYDIDSRTIHHNGRNLTIRPEDTQLLGDHNVFNIAVVYAVCKQLGMDDDIFMHNLKTFAPLHHRLEYIGTQNGVRYYDDSISTACETAISALESIPKVDTVLLGGMDRGIDYSLLIDYLLAHYFQNIVFMYASGKRMYEEMKEQANEDYMKNVYLCEDLNEAADLAMRITRKEYACVLSPASASYGYFKNFEERGDYFKQLIMRD